jgi:hypothetical protein
MTRGELPVRISTIETPSRCNRKANLSSAAVKVLRTQRRGGGDLRFASSECGRKISYGCEDRTAGAISMQAKPHEQAECRI